MQEYNRKNRTKTLVIFMYLESRSFLSPVKMVNMVQPPSKSGYTTWLNLHSSCVTKCSIIQKVFPILPGSWEDTNHHFSQLSFASYIYIKSAAGIWATSPQWKDFVVRENLQPKTCIVSLFLHIYIDGEKKRERIQTCLRLLIMAFLTIRLI